MIMRFILLPKFFDVFTFHITQISGVFLLCSSLRCLENLILFPNLIVLRHSLHVISRSIFHENREHLLKLYHFSMDHLIQHRYITGIKIKFSFPKYKLFKCFKSNKVKFCKFNFCKS